MNTPSKSLPESPAKEQPGEVAEMVKTLKYVGKAHSDQGNKETAKACLDAAAMIEKLGREVLQLGKSCAVGITGDPDDAVGIDTTEKAFAAIRESLRLGYAANNEANRLRLDHDCAELEKFLHSRCLHPDFEYGTTTGPRKAWWEHHTPDGDGWEKNIDEGRNGWERFEYHEEAYWRRRKPAAELKS